MKKILMILFAAFLTGQFNRLMTRVLQPETERSIILITVGGFIVASIFIFLSTKPRSPGALFKTYIIFSLSWILLDLSTRLIKGWDNSVYSLPRLTCALAAILFVYLCFIKKAIPLAAGITTLVMTLFISISYLSPAAYYYSSYGVSHPAVRLPAPADWHIVHKGINLHSDYAKDKYIILDFWSGSCGDCYKKFPLADSLYQSYQGRPDVELLSVLIGSAGNEATVKAKKTVSELYHFPVASGDTTAQRLFNILSFPTVIIVHNGYIVYKGDIEDVHHFLPH